MTALRGSRVPGWHLVGVLAAGALVGAAFAGSAAVATGSAAVAALIAALVVRPELAVGFLTFAVWLNLPALAVERHGVPLIAGAMFPLLLLVPIVHGRLRGRPVVITTGCVLMVVLLLVELLSTATAAYQSAALSHLREFTLEGVVLYVLIVNAVDGVSTLRLAVWGLIAAGACLALVTIYQQLTKSYFHPYGGLGQVDGAYFRGQSDVARLAGPLGDPNYYAQILLPVVPLALLTLQRERRTILRVIAGATAALVVMALAFTYSRGAALALLLVVLTMALLGYVRARHIAILAAGVAIVLAVVPAYRDRIATIASVGGATAPEGQQTSADDSARSRTTEMLAAGLAFLDHPVLGVGPDGFPFYYQVYAPRVGIDVRETTKSGADAGEVAQREAHDIFFGLAADLGAAGLAVFGAILWVTFAGLRRVRRRWLGERADLVSLADSLFLALLAYLAAGLFLSLAFERYFWLLAGLAGAVAVIGRRPAERLE
jgi:putative inorganic carbon (HCO3(-)) transporter